jgi:hypothetical protein
MTRTRIHHAERDAYTDVLIMLRVMILFRPGRSSGPYHICPADMRPSRRSIAGDALRAVKPRRTRKVTRRALLESYAIASRQVGTEGSCHSRRRAATNLKHGHLLRQTGQSSPLARG